MKTKTIYAILIFIIANITIAQQQPTPPLQTLMEVEYVSSNYELGTGMLGLGDINSDGKPDFAVSAYNIRKTFIYYGGNGVLDSTVDLVIRGGGIMAKGDLNGDGSMDLVVLAPGDSSTGYLNQLAIYFGREDSTIKIDTIPSLLITAEGAASRFGETFDIGDLNGDGFDDLVVGAPGYGLSQGKVYLYFGKPNFSNVSDFSVVADSSCADFGSSLEMEDINGDGYADLAIGSRVYINCSGSQTDGLLDIYYGKNGWQFAKDGYAQRFSKANTNGLYPNVFGLLDINVDGKADIAIVRGDSAYFFYGRSDSVRHTPDFVLTNPDTSFFYGFLGSPADIGDINNDGKNDLALLLSPGTSLSTCMAVYLGNSIPKTRPIGDRCRYGSYPFHIIVNVGDVNGDGVNDFGSVSPYDQFSRDGYFIIFKGDSNYMTSVKENHKQTLQKFNLEQNYPNPFNPMTTIEYTLMKEGKVDVKIFDSIGKEIKTLVNQSQQSGNYKVIWDGTDNNGERVSSGIYFYRLQIDKTTVTKKAVYIK